MKRALIFLFIALMGCATLVAKELKTAVYKVEQMTCENCVAKIKKNIRFEKGVKEIATDLSKKTVTISYDPQKTDATKIIKGFSKFKYEAVLME